ncbi:MAG TPA: ribosome small subunit-dependent GTPase A [Gammaproteobacteria bacterium]
MIRSGRVVARYRRHCLVETAGEERIPCQIGKRSLRPVAGDSVDWRPEPEARGVILAVHPRDTELKRTDSRGRPEVVAANLTQLVVVIAAAPPPDWFLVDRYLAAAELSRLGCVLVFNKLDLAPARPRELEDYRDLVTRICLTSAKGAQNLDDLAVCLRDHRSALIGQSGVGKSSLINALLGDSLQQVNELSEKSGLGRHTTSTAVLYRLPGGGELLDSPGVRDYAPHIEDPRDVQSGFREFGAYVGKCRFDDCAHLAEPECAVKAAVDSGAVTERRYASYRALLDLTRSLNRGPR